MMAVQAIETHPQLSATKTQSPLRQSSLLDIPIPAALLSKETKKVSVQARGGNQQQPTETDEVEEDLLPQLLGTPLSPATSGRLHEGGQDGIDPLPSKF